MQELTISDAPITFKFRKANNIEGAITIATYFGYHVPRAIATIDRNQAHLLYLYLKEHLNVDSDKKA